LPVFVTKAFNLLRMIGIIVMTSYWYNFYHMLKSIFIQKELEMKPKARNKEKSKHEKHEKSEEKLIGKLSKMHPKKKNNSY